MAAKAQKCRRLVEQVVGGCPMWIVADGAVLFYRCVLVYEGPLFVRMALVTKHVDRFGFQVSFILAVRVMAVGTGHFAFSYGVVRR